MSLVASQPLPQTSKCVTAASLATQPLSLPSMSCPASVNPVYRNAFVGIGLGVPASPLEAFTSMDPKDYVWGTPSPQQQQQLFHQFMQMAFFCHIAQTASNMVNGNHGQAQLPFLPFPFPPFPHVSGSQFPFNPAPPAMAGFQQTTTAPPCSASTSSQQIAPCQNQVQNQIPTVSTPPASNSVSTSSQDNTGSSSPMSPTSSGSAILPDQKDPSPLEACEIDCDVIQRLLDDSDICSGHDNLDQVMNGFEYIASPSGSDGSTATGETLLSSGIDSPMSVSGQQGLLGVNDDDLSLSDEEFDAVMKGMNGFTGHGDFADFDLDEIMTIEEKTDIKNASKSVPSIAPASQDSPDKPIKKSKAPKAQGGVSKVANRTKSSGIAKLPADHALSNITEFLMS